MKRFNKLVAIGLLGIVGFLGLSIKAEAKKDFSEITKSTPLYLQQASLTGSGTGTADAGLCPGGHCSHVSHASHSSHSSHSSHYSSGY